MSVRARFRVRILLHSVVLMSVMACLIALGDRLIVNPSMRTRTREHEAWVNQHSVAPPLTDHAAVARQLALAKHEAHLMLSVYDLDGQLVASSADSAIPPPPRDLWPDIAAGHPREYDDALGSGVFSDGVMVGIVTGRRREEGPPFAAVTLLLASFALAAIFAAVPLSRSVVRPLEALVAAVRRFGSGDLSARARLVRSDEIGDLSSEFDQMASRIESYVRAEKELLANVSHELRTPLARIRVVLELASDGDASRVRAYLAQDLAELERLVQDVITTARLDLGIADSSRVPLRWETIDPMRLVETSRARFESLHPGHELELRLRHMPAELTCDPVLLRRAIDNLLDNAVKYAPESRVELLVDTEDEKLCIEVMDLGPGMTTEQAAARRPASASVCRSSGASSMPTAGRSTWRPRPVAARRSRRAFRSVPRLPRAVVSRRCRRGPSVSPLSGRGPRTRTSSRSR